MNQLEENKIFSKETRPEIIMAVCDDGCESSCDLVGDGPVTEITLGRMKGPMDWLDTIMVWNGDTLAAEYPAYQCSRIVYAERKKKNNKGWNMTDDELLKFTLKENIELKEKLLRLESNNEKLRQMLDVMTIVSLLENDEICIGRVITAAKKLGVILSVDHAERFLKGQAYKGIIKHTSSSTFCLAEGK